jgi:hypothetical protein
LASPACRGATHRIGRLAHLTRRFGEILPLLFARQLLETTRGFLDLIGKRTLLRAAACHRRH